MSSVSAIATMPRSRLTYPFSTISSTPFHLYLCIYLLLSQNVLGLSNTKGASLTDTCFFSPPTLAKGLISLSKGLSLSS